MNIQNWVNQIPANQGKYPMITLTLMEYGDKWEVWAKSSNREREMERTTEDDNAFDKRDHALMYVGQLRERWQNFDFYLVEGLKSEVFYALARTVKSK